ncbi:MAG: acyl-CoA transferase [Inquilinus sp.]|uniref:acyl-CoA transferase n=1 Tax=Inquilinus sp. TaxID=1932117 RepID=UPI003F2A7EE0
MTTTAEAVLNALRDQLRAAIPDADAQRNVDVPERVVGRRIIIRDGRRVPEEQLGTEGPWYMALRPEIEMYAQAGTPVARDAALAALGLEVDAALSADLTLGGLVFGMDWGDPEIDTERIPGAAGVKAAVLEPTVDYQSATRIG